MLLGERDAFVPGQVHKMTVHGHDLVAYSAAAPGSELLVARDACPHRGASLGDGGTVVNTKNVENVKNKNAKNKNAENAKNKNAENAKNKNTKNTENTENTKNKNVKNTKITKNTKNTKNTGDVCIRCAYHGMPIGKASHPDRHYVCQVSQGLMWIDYTSLGREPLTEPPQNEPPTYPEFDDPAFRTFGYYKTLRGVNPVLMVENTLDWQHLASVHRVHFVDGRPLVGIHKTGAHGLATYTYASELFDLTIENEYHVPFTTSLRFKFRDKRTGRVLPPLLLWFTVTPVQEDEIRLNLRVSRAVLKAVPAVTDWIFRLIDELPLAEDAAVVSSIDAAEWSANRLTPGDAFVGAYRQAMREAYPEVLDWYVR